MSRWKDSAKRREWHNKRRADFVVRLLDYKSNNCCTECGWDEHTEILQFHHRDKSSKRFSFGIGSLGSYAWATVQSEIDKCDLLCPNCHMWLHFNEKSWFKKQALRSGENEKS